MSLSSSLFTGTSGLLNMSSAMEVVGNNISNVNTVGYKKEHISFADTFSQSIGTQGGIAQIGTGMAVGDVAQIFNQGSFESTGNMTDLAIAGNGFFMVSKANQDMNFYTRAGNFHFDNTGKLVNPENYIAQGWELDSETGKSIGSMENIIVEAIASPPKKTTRASMLTNLDADALSRSHVLANRWNRDIDGTINKSGMIDSKFYEYQTAVKVYDTLGTSHDIMAYYDKMSDSTWEYVLACDPLEDQRNLVQKTDTKGLLAKGTVTFSEVDGQLVDFTMSKFTGRIGNMQSKGVNNLNDIHYTIENHDNMTRDGYGFQLQFDGTNWSLLDLPANIATINENGDLDGDDNPIIDGKDVWASKNPVLDINTDGHINNLDIKDYNSNYYSQARILSVDAQYIEINFGVDENRKDEVDLKIKLDKIPAQNDLIGFDINDEGALHVQGLEKLIYSGEAKNENTAIQINNTDLMTINSKDVKLVWYPVEEEWHWGNPESALGNKTLISQDKIFLNEAAADTKIDTVFSNNVSHLSMISKDIKLQYDGTSEWNWAMPLKEQDFSSEFIIPGNENPTVNIINNDGHEEITAKAGTCEMNWTEVGGWAVDAADSIPDTTCDIVPFDDADLSTSGFDLIMKQGADPDAKTTTIRYEFDPFRLPDSDQTIKLTINPGPPVEYPNAKISSSADTAQSKINFDFNFNEITNQFNNDVTFDFLSEDGSGPSTSQTELMFTINPDSPPINYKNAILFGDEKEVFIDIDGLKIDSEHKEKHIAFEFKEPLAKGLTLNNHTDKSEINFDIQGSNSWQPLVTDDLDKDEYFRFTTDFLGGAEGSTEMEIEFDIGTKFDGLKFINDPMTTTQYAKSSSLISRASDGYGVGDLQDVHVTSDGVLNGIYSNGQSIPLYRLGLAKFVNDNGLNKEGGNLFRETLDSGQAIVNKPGENGLGTISPKKLEMSNVDIAEEFVSMITTQRGFQANSKTITTVDDMMGTVIQMKR
ncbi:MAG: hypothetical protein B6I26_02235 [Desulfobacteraceae bacterium 4572_130]|nr:MAG: hypothetical protein B6I26_02235 [Desulfobacteraceae bacterium 4572_130]